MVASPVSTSFRIRKRRRRRQDGKPSGVATALEEEVVRLLDQRIPVAAALRLNGARTPATATEASLISARRHVRFGLPRLDLFDQMCRGRQEVGEVSDGLRGKPQFHQVWETAKHRTNERMQSQPQAPSLVVESDGPIQPHEEEEPRLVAFFDAIVADPKVSLVETWRAIWETMTGKGRPQLTPGEQILDWAFRHPGQDGLAVELGSPVVSGQRRKRKNGVERVRLSRGGGATIQPAHLCPDGIWKAATKSVGAQPKAMRVTDAVACYLAMKFLLDDAFAQAVRLCRE